MAGTFSDSWRLTKTSFRLIWEDTALLVFPLVAGLSSLALLVLFGVGTLVIAPAILVGGSLENSYAIVGIALFVVAYFGTTFVTVYTTAALVGAATLKLNGQQPTASDGWRIARAHLGRLALWALFSATVGLVIQLIASRFRGIIGLVISAAAGITWTVVTYFMVPVLLYEHQGPIASLSRSARLFSGTFGRSLVSNLALGLIIGAGLVAAIVLGVVGLFLLFGGSVLVGVLVVIAALAVAIFVLLVGATAEGILRAALYRYATTGKIDRDLIPPAYLASAPPPLSWTPR
jgi:hypothetical protein